MVHGNLRHRQHGKRVLCRALDKVVRRLEATEGPHREEPVPIKKMLKGDVAWATQKTILIWIIDTLKMDVELPHHHISRLL
jgi:hypothetical protein